MHTDEERGFVAVVDQDEMAHALEMGYKVKKVYNALVWPENEVIDGVSLPRWSNDLFKGNHPQFFNPDLRLHSRFR
jgi:hypothetical protein